MELHHRGGLPCWQRWWAFRPPVVAPPSLASLAVIACGVHGPETGRGQRDEHLRVFGDCGRQIVMATVHAGVYELPGIAGIEIRAGRAGDSASVVASGPHPKLATEAVGSCQTDRIRTEPSILRFIPPGLEVAGGGATHHLRHHADGVGTGRKAWQCRNRNAQRSSGHDWRPSVSAVRGCALVGGAKRATRSSMAESVTWKARTRNGSALPSVQT